MSSATQPEPSFISADDEDSRACADLLRTAIGLDSSPQGAALTNAELLTTAFSSLDIDSLTTLEFVMEVENRFEIELDEAEVNRCVALADFVKLVRRARDVQAR